MKFRASQVGKIIRKPKARKKITGESYLRELFIDQITSTHKEIGSKYFDNGNMNEQAGLQLLQDTLYPKKFVSKYPSDKVLENEWVTGHPDCVAPDGILYDIKNAYIIDTFYNASFTWKYQWQIKSYLWLTGKKHGRLFYCLNDLPEKLLNDEKRKLFYSGGYDSEEQTEYKEACKKLEKRFKCGHLSPYERFKVWDVYLSTEDIETIKNSVKTANEVLNNMEEERQELIIKNKKLLK